MMSTLDNVLHSFGREPVILLLYSCLRREMSRSQGGGRWKRVLGLVRSAFITNNCFCTENYQSHQWIMRSAFRADNHLNRTIRNKGALHIIMLLPSTHMVSTLDSVLHSFGKDPVISLLWSFLWRVMRRRRKGGAYIGTMGVWHHTRTIQTPHVLQLQPKITNKNNSY